MSMETSDLSRQLTVKTSGGQSLVDRRPYSRRLPPLKICGHRKVTGEERLHWGRGEDRGRVGETVVEEGRELFSNFMYDQAQTERPEAVERLRTLTPASYRNAKLVRIGRELRHIAQSLVDSPQRQRVRQRASQVNPDITRSDFQSLLKGLFGRGGTTREGIVVLFFFCSDVALRCLTDKGAEGFEQFVAWSLSFISESVCAWVRSHGGWAKVMSRGLSTLSVSLALAGVIVVGIGVFKYVTRS
ncbi:hypothetical protein ACOMHN_047150 [Nucella lapillus]